MCRFCSMDDEEIYSEPSKVNAQDGHVVVDGPDGVDVSLTPESAEETADRLFQASAKAAGQRRLKDFPIQPAAERK